MGNNSVGDSGINSDDKTMTTPWIGLCEYTGGPPDNRSRVAGILTFSAIYLGGIGVLTSRYRQF